MLLAVFTVGFAVMTTVRAAGKPFWHDEIFTLVAADLPTAATLWTALRDGLDLSPPLNTFATRYVHETIGAGHVASRLPPMIGVWLACLVAFTLVRRRTNVVVATAALILPCYTSVYRYAYEARGYGLMTACFAVALYAWSEAAAGRHRRWTVPLLAVALAAGLWAHYYAVLAFAPIAAGEVARAAGRRRADWPLWSAIAAGALGLVPLLPLLQVGAASAGTFWSATTHTGVVATYQFLLSPLTDWWWIASGVLLAAALGAGWIADRRVLGMKPGLPRHELVAGLVALAMPALGVALGAAVSGGLVPRYVLPAAVSVSIALPYVVWRWSGTRGWAGGVLAAALVGAMTWTVADALTTDRFAFRSPLAGRAVLTEALAGPQPVVVTGGLVFLQLWYYAPADLRDRLVYVADPDAALRWTGSDTIDTGLLSLARWAPVRVEPYEPFVAAHPSFVVYRFGSGWILERLADEGATLGAARPGDPGAAMVPVRLPQAASSSR